MVEPRHRHACCVAAGYRGAFAGCSVLMMPGRGTEGITETLNSAQPARPPAMTAPAARARGLRSGNSSAVIAITGTRTPPRKVRKVVAQRGGPEANNTIRVATNTENKANAEKAARTCRTKDVSPAHAGCGSNRMASEMTSAAIAHPRSVRNICPEPVNEAA